ncbi:MAG: biotin--[acetyl-CoA-carboxylase] ligase [Desulfovibrionaceae bacterium]|nr:biotin--[acetyl-CoA-carboxylase] ligase [Desulfovibrionaceae bacterium]MBF0513964.1 biotin--[acetyl-CoA-carboxylase] ligase [Desulfovibrionaceae bacterium]
MNAVRFLTEPVDGLCEAAAPEDWAGLAGFAGGAGITACGPCTSSLDVAWRLIAEGRLAPWESVLAPVQRAGRGQLGRHWISAPGNVFAALAWPGEDREWGLIAPLVAGYLVVEYLAGRGITARLKWPNDIMVAGSGCGPGELGKAGGILVEERGGRALAGIGLNLVTVPEAGMLRRDHAVPAACLAGQGIAEGPLLLWDRLVNFMRAGYASLRTDKGPGEATGLIQERLAWLGERVALAEGAGEPRTGRLLGLASDGGLILALDGGGEKVAYNGQLARCGE